MSDEPALSCTNCGEEPVVAYCAACGQQRLTPHDFTARAFLQDMLNEFISMDGRFWRSLWILLRHPGLLAREYVEGRGARYMRPLSLFLLLNLAFFLVQPHTGLLQWHLEGYLAGNPRAVEAVNRVRTARATAAERARESHGEDPRAVTPKPMDVFEAESESTLQDLKKSMLLVAIPLFAVALAALSPRSGHRYAEHLVFTTYFYAFALFALTVVVQLFYLALFAVLRAVHASDVVTHAVGGERALVTILFVLLAGYLYVALRRMYGDSRVVAAARAVALFFVFQTMIITTAVRMFSLTLRVI